MKSVGTTKFTVGYNFQDETCHLQDTPNPNDTYASVCISGLITLHTLLAAAGEGQFPEEYGKGIVISADPPPSASPHDP